MVQAFKPLGYHCLSCSMIAKLSFAFQRFQNTFYVALHCHESYRSPEVFNSYLATSLTKFDVHFCRVDPHVEVDGCRVSPCFCIIAMAFQ